MNLKKLTKISLYFRIVIAILLMGSMVPAASPVMAGTATVDGSIDDAYGAPIAVDKIGDGNANANMDLLELYVTEDADSFYFAFTANGDLGAANWGKYAIYIDTDGVAGSGATSDAWGRAVTAADPHKPEYAIYSWIDAVPYGVEDTEVYTWDGTAWGAKTTLDEAALGAGATSVIEWKVAKAKLGNPEVRSQVESIVADQLGAERLLCVAERELLRRVPGRGQSLRSGRLGRRPQELPRQRRRRNSAARHARGVPSAVGRLSEFVGGRRSRRSRAPAHQCVTRGTRQPHVTIDRADLLDRLPGLHRRQPGVSARVLLAPA